MVLDGKRTIPARPRNYSVNGKGCGVVRHESIPVGKSVKLTIKGTNANARLVHCESHGTAYHCGLEIEERSRQAIAAAFARAN